MDTINLHPVVENATIEDAWTMFPDIPLVNANELLFLRQSPAWLRFCRHGCLSRLNPGIDITQAV